MSETKLYGKANEEFTEQIIELLKEWKLVEKKEGISEIRLLMNLDNSIIAIDKNFDEKGDIKL